MKKILCLVLCVLFVLSFFGCNSKDDTKAPANNADIQPDLDNLFFSPSDISKITDLRCYYSVNEDEKLYVEGDVAKDLFLYIHDQLSQSQSMQGNWSFSLMGQNKVYLNFVSGVSTESGISYGGVFWIGETDYTVYSGSPETSAQFYAKAPSGTYNTVIELISQ